MNIFARTRVVLGVLLLVPIAAWALSAPIVNTQMPASISEKDATLSGFVNGGELSDTRTWFEWGSTTRADVYETARVTTGSSVGTQTRSLIGLAPATQYRYRVVAENANGRSYGAFVTFTTKDLPSVATPPPLVLSLDPTNITDTSVRLRGYSIPQGTTDVTRWFEWGQSPVLGTLTNKTSQSSGQSELWTADLSGLRLGTTYFFRAVVENGAGRSLGELRSFVTPGTAPVLSGSGSTSTTGSTSATSGSSTTGTTGTSGTGLSEKPGTGSIGITTGDARKITDSFAELPATYHTTGGQMARIYFELGRASVTEQKNDMIVWYDGDGEVYMTAGILDPDTTYQYRATITVPGGESKTGATKTFHTLPRGGGSGQVVTGIGGADVGSFAVPSGIGNVSAGTTTTTPASGSKQSLGDYLSNLFTPSFLKKKTTDVATTTATGSPAKGAETTGTSTGGTDAALQGVGSGLFAPVGDFFRSLKGSPPIAVSAASSGGDGPHQPVEYRTILTNTTSETMKNLAVKVGLPSNVVYIGDDTKNEFLVSDGTNGERVYTLPVPELAPGASKIVSLIGITTADTTTAPWPTISGLYADGKAAKEVLAEKVSWGAFEDLVAKARGESTSAAAAGTSSSSKASLWSRIAGAFGFGGTSADSSSNGTGQGGDTASSATSGGSSSGGGFFASIGRFFGWSSGNTDAASVALENGTNSSAAGVSSTGSRKSFLSAVLGGIFGLLLPSSLFWWILYILFVGLILFVWVRGRALYDKRKAVLDARMHESGSGTFGETWSARLERSLVTHAGRWFEK